MCYVNKSCIVFALLPAQCAVYVRYCIVVALLPAQCAVCKWCIVLALLQVQCTMCVSRVLCLHYCQHSVLCE